MPQADPFRLHVQKNLTALLETIDGTNGYVYDLRRVLTDPDNPVIHVWRGRQEFGEEDPLPCLAILETPLQPDQIPTPEASTKIAQPWDLIIQGFVLDDKANPSDTAVVLAADVERCLAQEKLKERAGTVLGTKRITKLNFGRSVSRPPDNISSVAYCWTPVTILLAEDLADPYSDEPWT